MSDAAVRQSDGASAILGHAATVCSCACVLDCAAHHRQAAIGHVHTATICRRADVTELASAAHRQAAPLRKMHRSA
eukprot:5220320-Prymnesium_polylepis.1